MLAPSRTEADIHEAWCRCDSCTGSMSPQAIRRDVRAAIIGAFLALVFGTLKFFGAF